jgi:hypothetical protein
MILGMASPIGDNIVEIDGGLKPIAAKLSMRQGKANDNTVLTDAHQHIRFNILVSRQYWRRSSPLAIFFLLLNVFVN